MAIAYNIPVDIPQTVDERTIDFKELKSMVQEFVNRLYMQVGSRDKASDATKKKYSRRIQHLREMSRKTEITGEDLMEDDRLAYLLSK